MSRKVIFISYANEAMAYSLRRIGRQARKLGIFDEVILYTPKDLPQYVRDTNLLGFSRGGGFMCWKPAVIYETLQKFDDGDIAVWVDAGCTLRKSTEWKILLSLMEKYDTVCFQYEDKAYPEWEKFGTTSPAEGYWTKRFTLEFLEDYLQNNTIRDIPQILTGVIFMKGKNNTVLKQWRDLIIKNPALVADPDKEEIKNQLPTFIGHRHDQSVFTPLAALDDKTLILPEIFEYFSPDSFVWASRIRARNFLEYITIQTKHYLRIWLGDRLFERIKRLFK